MLQNIGNILDVTEDWIVAFIHSQVLVGPFLLLLIEEMGIPLPVPGDIIITYTGYQVSKGSTSYPIAFINFLIAIIIGSSILYWFSVRYGRQIISKLGKFIDLDEEKLGQVEDKFNKYGPLVIIIGRHIPGFRIPITVFSGISGISYPTFIISTLVSVIFWIAFYLSLGMRLGPKTLALVHAHRGYYLFFIIPAVLFLVTFLFLRYKKTKV